MITSIELEPELAKKVGLVPVKLDRLGKLVLLVGPNGHGKTRIMRLVQTMMGGGDALHGVVPDRITGTRSGDQERMIALEYSLGGGFYRARDFTPSNFNSQLDVSRRSIDLGTAHVSIDIVLTHAARMLYDAEHPRGRTRESVQRELRRVHALDKVLRALLGDGLGYDVGPTGDVIPILFGRPFEPQELSRGQHVLLCWAHMLSQQHDELASSILFFDEPELHLHPDACWKAIERLMDEVLGEHSQIWLATHSLPLVASACSKFGTDVLHYVQKGKVEHAGNKIEKVMGGLLGGHDQRETLNTFLGDVDRLAFDQFAAECLMAPGVAEFRDKDDQGTQVTGLLRERLQHGSVDMLEYAAGRGRLAMATARLLASLPPGTCERLTYATYHHLGFASGDEVGATRNALAAIAATGAKIKMYFDRPPGEHAARGALVADELRACTVPGSRKFDLVLMANTLHEVPVQEWQSTFEDLAEVMTPQGELLLVEDQRPRIGELPYKQGFLILDRIDLRALFGVEVRGGEAQEGRLTAFLVPRAALRNVNADTIHAALRTLERRARDEVKRLRERGDPSAKAGRLHALYAMMSINVQLIREQLPTGARTGERDASERSRPLDPTA